MGSARQRVLMLAALAAAGCIVAGGGAWAVVLLMNAPSVRPEGASPDAPLGVAADGTELRTVEAALQAARRAMDQDRAKVAEGVLSQTVERFPGDQRARLMLGECLLQLGRGEEAYAQYEAGIQIGPDNAEYRHAAATIAAGIGRLEDARTHYLMAQKLAPSNPKFPLYLAQIQRKLGDNDAARASLVLATKLDPELSIGWAGLAGIALDENRLSVARGYIERARKLEPERTEWRIIEAKILRRDNQPRESIALLTAIAEAARRTDAAVIEELALCHGMLGEPMDAAGLYIAALGEGDENAEWSFQAGLWLERAGQKDRAIMYARHAAAKGHEGAKKLAERLDRGE
jgi:tetratricopeptide (TPR) repeat protein